jgi:MATE family multidrug resistance protein
MTGLSRFFRDPERATIRKNVRSMALPAVGEQLLNTFVGLTNTFLVGNLSAEAAAILGYNSTSAIAGIGLGNQIVMLTMILFMAVSVGSTALIARARGARDMDEANRVLRQSMLIGGAMGILASLLGVFFARPMLSILGPSEDVLQLATTYLQIVSSTFLFASLLFIGTAALRGVGDTRTPLYIMLGVNAVNILLSWLLVNGQFGLPVLGMTGVSIAAAIARGGGGLFLLALLVRGRSNLQLSLNLKPDVPLLKRIINIGLPSAGEQVVFQGAMIIFVRFITGLGTVAYAAHNIVIAIDSFSFLPGLGYATAATALVGQSLGAKKPEEAESNGYEALWQSMIFMSTIGIIMFLFPVQILSFFTNDQAVIDAATPILRLVGLRQPFMATNFVLSGGLRGAGDTRWPLYTKLISTWGIRMPLTPLFLWFGWGLFGAWIAMSLDLLSQSILAWWRYQKGAWKTLKV